MIGDVRQENENPPRPPPLSWLHFRAAPAVFYYIRDLADILPAMARRWKKGKYINISFNYPHRTRPEDRYSDPIFPIHEMANCGYGNQLDFYDHSRNHDGIQVWTSQDSWLLLARRFSGSSIACHLDAMQISRTWRCT